MARRIITQEDVKAAAASGALQIGPDDVVTQAARDLAKRSGVSIDAAPGAAAPSPMPVGLPSGALPVAPSGEMAVVTAVGRNRLHILAEITGAIAELNGSVHDISQRIVGDYFSTVLTVDLTSVDSFGTFKAALEGLSHEGDYRVLVQHERIFRAMHRL